MLPVDLHGGRFASFGTAGHPGLVTAAYKPIRIVFITSLILESILMTPPKYEFFNVFLLVALTSSGRFFLRLLPASESLLDLNIFTREW